MTSVTHKNDFQQAAAFLDRTADALHKTAQDPLKAAAKSVERAKSQAGKAGDHLAGVPGNLYLAGKDVGEAGKNLGYASLHGLFAAVDAVDGTLAVGEVALRGVAGSAIGAVASATWLGEQGMSGARFAFLNISKFFLAVANGISKMLGDSGHQMVSKSLADPSAKRLSERLFDTSGDQFKLSAAAAGYAWDAYADAAREVFGKEDSVLAHTAGAVGNVAAAGANVAGAVVNAGAFAVHSGAVLGNLGIAAVQAGATPVVLLAELGVRAAKASVLAAERGVEASRDLTILAAEITAACGNALAHPDQADYKVTPKTLEDFAAKIQKAQDAA